MRRADLGVGKQTVAEVVTSLVGVGVWALWGTQQGQPGHYSQGGGVFVAAGWAHVVAVAGLVD